MASPLATMKAVILKDEYHIAVETIPIPTIKCATDVIIKVYRAGLCGSDLHFYRGLQPKPYAFVMGHEALGKIVQAGAAVQDFKVGDLVIAPFSTSCGSCFYCEADQTARCAKGNLLGSPKLAGAQAEYLLLPLADTTLFHLPNDVSLDTLLVMADVLPTGCGVALNARRLPFEERTARDGREKKGDVCVVIGCGPVGLCAITCACSLFRTVYATDLSSIRLESAQRHGAIALPLEELKREINQSTEGRGADAVLEVVGHPSALSTALELVRPCGVISSCGVYTQQIEVDGATLYGKNVRLQFGRCSVRTMFPMALEVLRNNRELFDGFVEHSVPIDEAVLYYKLFEKGRIGKTVFNLADD